MPSRLLQGIDENSVLPRNEMPEEEHLEGGEMHIDILDESHSTSGASSPRKQQELRMKSNKDKQLRMRSEMEDRAKLSVEMAEAVKTPKRYKTLYYGLKLNHPRNAAVVHPLMYMLRRIIFAFIIVYMDQVKFWNVILFMNCTLVMLAYGLAEHQWKSQVINYQHIFNESTLYTATVFLLLFSSYLEPQQRFALGYAFIALVLIFVIYNTIIMLLFSLDFMILIVKRLYYQKVTRRHLKEEAKKVSKHIEGELNSKSSFAPDEIKAWFSDPINLDPAAVANGDENNMITPKREWKYTLQVETRDTHFGGLQGEIVPKKQSSVITQESSQKFFTPRTGKINQVFVEMKNSSLLSNSDKSIDNGEKRDRNYGSNMQMTSRQVDSMQGKEFFSPADIE